MTVVVRTADDLWKLLRPESVLHPFRKPRPLLQIPELPRREACLWEQRLDSLRQQCGCTSGAIAMGLFTILFVTYSALHISPASNWELASVAGQAAILVAGLIFSALIGKFVGLLAASLRFRRTCLALHQRLHTKTMIVPQPARSCCSNHPVAVHYRQT